MNANIISVPHYYDIRWCKVMNRLIKDIAPQPWDYEQTGYLKGKDFKYKVLPRIMQYARRNKIKTVHFINCLEDFAFDWIKTTEVSKYTGMIHGTSYLNMIGSDDRFKVWEDAVANLFNVVFVGSHFIKDTLPYSNTVVVGYPNAFNIREPNLSSKIIFNHRLQKDKGIHNLKELSSNIKQDLIISTPKASPNHLEVYKEQFKVYYRPSSLQYFSVLRECGFGVSFCGHEPFGTAVVDGISNGLLYFVPDTVCGHDDFILPDVKFKNVTDLENKIEYYKLHEKERIELVKTSQEQITKYEAQTWKNKIKTYLL